MHFAVIDPDGLAIELTDHAVDRFLERVDPRSSRGDAMIELASHGRAIRRAAAFGATIVRLATGHRLILALGEPKVVTVLPRGCIDHSDRRVFPSLALLEV